MANSGYSAEGMRRRCNFGPQAVTRTRRHRFEIGGGEGGDTVSQAQAIELRLQLSRRSPMHTPTSSRHGDDVGETIEGLEMARSEPALLP
jgi:hypothetical protein